ncbi:hypothetical protein J2S43_002556 [Catenuloplanes nepalensis]|uniref:DUF7868 domain-containing protein n=1 Tax=Catenuloplanes nepalensis TaxID=587533 RepID=A0ABT9MRM6_9ACTN|nr:hypothetical protein [Catenuloplanes nepalensis]MDP9794044.1 hypothetical protein [Catenuloplanes nepalensis]
MQRGSHRGRGGRRRRSSWPAFGVGRTDPADAGWRNQSWRPSDTDGNPVTISNARVVDTAPNLGYVYQDGVAPGARPTQEPIMSARSDGEPEFVGASDRPITLTGDPARVEVPIDEPTVATRRAATPAQVLLNLEDVEAERSPATVYEVYVRPIGTPDAVPYHVGNVSFFGIEHFTGRSGEGPHGFRRTFDISDWVAGLRDRGEWSDQGAAVSFRPVTVEVPPDVRASADAAIANATIEARSAPVTIGRVSIFYR